MDDAEDAPTPRELADARSVIARHESYEAAKVARRAQILADLDRVKRLQRLGIPPCLVDAWNLSDIDIATHWVSAWETDDARGYIELWMRLTFGDGRVFTFYDGPPHLFTIHMAHKDFAKVTEFGVAPTALPFLPPTTRTIGDVWRAAQTAGDNGKKHQCCAVAAVIFYAYRINDRLLPLNLTTVLCRTLGLADTM